MLVEDVHQVAFALLVGAERGEVGGELLLGAQVLVTGSGGAQEASDLLVGVVPSGPLEGFDQAPADLECVGRPRVLRLVGVGESLPLIGAYLSGLPYSVQVAVVEERVDQHGAAVPAALPLRRLSAQVGQGSLVFASPAARSLGRGAQRPVGGKGVPVSRSMARPATAVKL
ncbi:hypothetical protein [Streptomyces sp. MZ04]|uniref:hypothetical protein n=1 Tax=Streptomyces sp. MZ04 TaxID=2559236 RepID=UPI00107EDA57|nr:hypothetical protein [Streptomyces sp. MZ04]TGB05614.1 hypothetical protein E2651_24685 [Streptomyces sp. MZ04]